MSELSDSIRSQPESLSRSLRYQSEGGAKSLEDAAALLCSAGKVVIAAMGASLFASIPLQYFLSSQGINAIAIEAGELLHYLDGTWENSVVILVSRSGESVEIAKLLARMKGKVPIIGVTNEPESLLSRSADVTLGIASLPDQIVAIQTYTGTILVLHLLCSALVGKRDIASEEVRALVPAFASFVESNMASLAQWDAFLKPDAPTYFLARGPSLATAHEGALLFHEVAKSPAVTMPIASFRHGPVEVVDPGFHAFVFAAEDNTRELNLALARDIVHFGGHVCLVGPTSREFDGPPMGDIPKMPATLRPLFEVVPLQVAALRLALLRGIEPGSFRYAPQVAVDEASFVSGKSSR